MDSGERKEKKGKKKIGIKIKDPGPKESSEQGAFYSRQERDLGIPKRKNKNWFIRGTPHVSAFNSFEPLFWS